MQFSEKLNFLMDITETTNSALSLHVSLDASYISRLRSGKRRMPRNAASIRDMACYFSRRCRENHIQRIVGEMLGLHPLPQDQALLSDIIARWLITDEEDGAETVEQFLGGLSGMQSRLAAPAGPHKSNVEFPRDESAIYYGVEGKRRAVIYFLSEVIALGRPQTLLLFSDEETSWMTEDPAFMHQWAALMTQTLTRGCRIKIIHTVSRDLGEMLIAIGQWMPLYMMGTIEPYFCPRKRDGLFKRTLFIAPGTAAVVSGSVGDHTSHAANLLFRNAAAVAAYEGEFLQYLRLCRPLMRIFNAKDKEACRTALLEFEKQDGCTMIKTESLSLLTLPESVYERMLARTGTPEQELLQYHSARVNNFRRLTEASMFTEIIALPEPADVAAGRVKVALSDMLGDAMITYTPEEYRLHLLSIIALLKAYKNYHVHIIGRPVEDRYMVYVKEDLGVVVAKTSQPPVVLMMNEGNMTASFWDFLIGIIGGKTCEDAVRESVIGELEAYAKAMRQ